MSLQDKYTDENGSAPSANRDFIKPVVSFAIVLTIATAIVYGTFFYQTRVTSEWLLHGQPDRAFNVLSRWTWLPIVNGQVYEQLGTAALLSKGYPSAETYFRKSEKMWFFHPTPRWKDVLKLLWSQARYDDGLAYCNHLKNNPAKEKFLDFYLAAFYTGLNRLEEASSTLPLAAEVPELQPELSALQSEIEHRNATHQFSFLYDRKNLPLVSMSLGGQPQILYESLRPVLQQASGDYVALLSKNPHQQAALTIDYRIQSAAMQAFGNYAGAIVVLNPNTGEILAAASHPKGIGSNYPADSSLVFDSFFEPGSIIKIITLAGALEKKMDLTKIFPDQCDGQLKLSENKILYCWKVHGTVPDWNAAMAGSCNISFARIGLALGSSDLLTNLNHFGFNAQLSHSFLPLQLGKVSPSQLTEQYISKLSIGLDYLQISPLHAAMVACAIANRGVAMVPRLLLHYRNAVGIAYGEPENIPFRRLMSEKNSQILTAAMKEVVDNPDGTGHRAQIPTFPFAMKTGTAGDGSKGYNAFIIGFGPLPEPKIGFAIYLEHSGKAEFEAARITKLFLESIQRYI